MKDALPTTPPSDALEYAVALLTQIRHEWYTFTGYSQLKQDIDKFLDTPRAGGRVVPLHPAKSCSEGVEAGSVTQSETASNFDPGIWPRSAGVRTITLTTDQQQRGVGAYQQWKANVSNPSSSAFGGNLHDLARRMFEAMTNADPQEISAEASSRADGEASAAKKPGATASTPCQPGEAETPCGSAPLSATASSIPDFEGLIDNAAGASQSRELLEDPITRGAVKANVYDRLVEIIRTADRHLDKNVPSTKIDK